jgi:hypothetical protein
MTPASAAFRSTVPTGAHRLEPQKAAKRAADLAERLHAQADEIVGKSFPDLWAHLTIEGQRMLVGELLEANTRPRTLQAVVEAWYRTLSLRQDSDRERHSQETARIHLERPITTSEDLRDRLGL